MGAFLLRGRIKHQEDLDLGFPRMVAAMPGGDNLYRCIQCGTCSSTCPLSIYMDFTPRRIIALTRGGFRAEVLTSNTIWLCASCYACTVDCPREVKITDIMYGLKRLAIEEQVYPKRFAIPVLAREFFKSVMKTGRSNEARTVTWMILKTAPLRLLKQVGLGLRLLIRGRMSVAKESMEEGLQQLHRLMDRIEAAKEKA